MNSENFWRKSHTRHSKSPFKNQNPRKRSSIKKTYKQEF